MAITVVRTRSRPRLVIGIGERIQIKPDSVERTRVDRRLLDDELDRLDPEATAPVREADVTVVGLLVLPRAVTLERDRTHRREAILLRERVGAVELHGEETGDRDVPVLDLVPRLALGFAV